MGAEDWVNRLINTMNHFSSLPEPKRGLDYASQLYLYMANVREVLGYAARRLQVPDLANHINEEQLKTMYDFYKGQLLKYVGNDDNMSREMEKMGGDKKYVEHAINQNKKLIENIEKQTPTDANGYINESLKNLTTSVRGVNNWCRFFLFTTEAARMSDGAYKKFYDFIKPVSMELFNFEFGITEKYDNEYVVPEPQQVVQQNAEGKPKNEKDEFPMFG